MKNESLDDIALEIKTEAENETASEVELVNKEEKQAQDEKYQKCLESGYKAMGFLRAAIEKVEPELSFGDDEQEKAFADEGAKKHADVLMLADDIPEVPEWVKKITPYVALGWFYVQTGYGVYQFRQQRLEAEQEKPEGETENGK